MSDIMPSKKGKSSSDAKKKDPIHQLEENKKALTKGKTSQNKAATVAIAREGTSANPGAALGPMTSMVKYPVVEKKLLEGVIPPTVKEEVKKMDLDQAILKFFHIVGQVVI